MSLKYAILGILEVNPISGYDLKKYFNSSVNSYWSASHSQIYRTLDEITKEQSATIEIIRQEKLPDKKIFILTEKGKNELISWLKIPKGLPVIRHQILLQFSLAHLLPFKQIIKLLNNYKKMMTEKLKQLKSPYHQATLEYARNKKERLLWDLTLKNGILYYKNEINWVNDCITIIKKQMK